MKNRNTLGDLQNFTLTHYPTSAEEITKLVIDFNERREKFFAVSTGNNWGYGCDHSHQKTTHCLNLKHMNRILDFDEPNGLITIEPGVTYGQLAEFLKNKDSDWITPVHGGGPDCSLIGNTLERGYGITPITDHYQACQGLEAILPNGKKYNSSLKSIGQYKLDQLFRNGVGPYLDGIFTQSNFGIVTQMTLKLAPKSQKIELFFVDIREADLGSISLSIKILKQKLGTSLGGINLMNKERLLSMLVDYPQKDIKERKALSDDFVKSKVKEQMISDWTLVGAIYGDKEIVKAVKKIVKKELRYLNTRKVFINEGKINLLDKISRIFPTIFGRDIRSKVESLVGIINILNGIPQNTALKLAYWKNLNEAPDNNLNPNRDNCGLIWYAPLVEMHVSKVLEYVKFVRDVSNRFNITPLITLTTVDDLCFDSTIPILFNRDDLEDQTRAHEYFNALFIEGREKGFYPYRLGTNSMPQFLDDLDDDYKKLLFDLKKVFDPNNLFAPGRYVPGEVKLNLEIIQAEASENKIC